jgi:drug/metabolite transporter (DMT)-like permease
VNDRKYIGETNLAALMALAAALLFGLNSPCSKMLLAGIPPMFMAAFLYIGAAIGMSAILLAQGLRKGKRREAGLSGRDGPWIAMMILLDTAAPIFMMFGLTMTTAANASILTAFEAAATSVFARVFFKEAVGRRMWASVGLVTLASMALSVELSSASVLIFSPGSLLVLGACLCWGLENNCTRRLSEKNPVQIVAVKGFGAGTVALILALTTEHFVSIRGTDMTAALALGFITYGLSVCLYIGAQRRLGAARTGVYFAAAPFFGALIAVLLLGESPGVQFWAGSGLMIVGTLLAVIERHSHFHIHPALSHEHKHSHADGHHMHGHEQALEPDAEHSHEHTHEETEHEHEHRPDIHHRHRHVQ